MVPKRLPHAPAAALTCVIALAGLLATTAFPIAAGARSARVSILPPANPQYSLAIGKYPPVGCADARDVSVGCMKQSLAMINAGRRSEDLGPLMLPSNWGQLDVAQQLFVLTELERTARGLPADTGMAANLDASAVTGADEGRDPGDYSGSLWAGGDPNAIVVMADWIYEDGVFANGFSENLNCSVTSPSGCWKHRDVLLHDGSLPGLCREHCQIGAGYSPSGFGEGLATGLGSDSYAEVVARSSQPQTLTWASELPDLPACEQGGDTCAWTGSPVATVSGIVVVGVHPTVTAKPVSTTPIEPWFTLSVSGTMNKRGHVSLAIQVGIKLVDVTAVARRGTRQRTLAVSQLSSGSYTARGTLARGTWTVTILYHTQTREAVSHLTFTV